jgi:hypothetical protein
VDDNPLTAPLTNLPEYHRPDETVALSRMVEHMESLPDEAAQRRVLQYLVNRYGVKMGSVSPIRRT